MRLFIRKASLLAAVAAVGLGTRAYADLILTSLTPGDLVVVRGGDAINSQTGNTLGSQNDSSGEVNAYLDEYTWSGSYVGTIDVPGVTLPGTSASSHEGGINLSQNGQWLTFGGYTQPAGAVPHAADGTETEVIGEIGSTAASLNTSTVITGAATPNSNTSQTGLYLRTVNSIDGNEFYYTAKYINSAGGAYVGTNTDSAGLLYVNGVGPSATAQTLQPGVDWRSIIIGNNTLYGGTGSSSVGTHGPYVIGNFGTLPNPSNVTVTATSTTLTHTLLGSYPGGQSASNLALADLSGDSSTQNGYDVMYTVGDQSTAGIVKYYYNGSAWVTANLDVPLNSTNVQNPTGLVVQPDPSDPAWEDIAVSGSNGIFTYVDKGGAMGAIASDAFSLVAQVGTTSSAFPDANFYGMALAPTVAVPEPASLAIVTVGSLTLLARRRRKA